MDSPNAIYQRREDQNGLVKPPGNCQCCVKVALKLVLLVLKPQAKLEFLTEFADCK